MNIKVLALLLVFIPLFFVGSDASAKVDESPHENKGVICHKTRGHHNAPHVAYKQRRLRTAITGGSLDGSFSDRRKSLAYENTVADRLNLPRFQKLDEIIKAQSGLSSVPSETDLFFC